MTLPKGECNPNFLKEYEGQPTPIKLLVQQFMYDAMSARSFLINVCDSLEAIEGNVAKYTRELENGSDVVVELNEQLRLLNQINEDITKHTNACTSLILTANEDLVACADKCRYLVNDIHEEATKFHKRLG